MGILYNRFTPEPQPQSLIPYSNQSDIVSYLVPSSFQGSSSTTWGDDYPKPMQRGGYGLWEYNSDDSVNLSVSQLSSGFSIPMPSPDSISTFTVYMVVKYHKFATTISNYLPGFQLVYATSGNTKINEAYNDSQVRAAIISNNQSTYTSYLTPPGSPFGNYHAYAFRYQVNNFCHVIDDGNLTNITIPSISSRSHYNFLFFVTTQWSVDVKFLSIVKGAESDSTILDNVHNIMTELNIP